MSTTTRIQEADDASVAFQVALTQIGAKTVEDALTLWSDVPPDLRPEQASRWLGRAIRLVLFRRKRSQALALAYYRLARALRTGTTIADPYHPEPTYVRLSDLRREFTALTDQYAAPANTGEAEPESEQATPQPEAESQVDEQPEAQDEPKDEDSTDPGEDDDLILVEEIKGLQDELDRIEKAAEAEAREALTNLGAKNSRAKQAKIDLKQAADQADQERADAHAKAGNRQAASASRIAMNGARSTIYATGQKDPKVIAWVRLSRTGTPCGWCAMLISRGPVYKSAKTAGDADLYHDNCKCYAMPVYGLADFESSPLYSLNREYARLWPIVTKGLGGDAALSAWRHFIRQQAKTQAVAA